MSYYSSDILPYYTSSYLSKPYVGIEELGSDDSSLNRKLYSYRRSTSPVAYDYGVSRRYASDLLSPSLSSYYYPYSSSSYYPYRGYYSSISSPYYSSYSSLLPHSYRYHYSYTIPPLVHRPYQPIINKTYRYYTPNYTIVTPPPPTRVVTPIYNYHYHPSPKTTRTTVTRTTRSYSIPPPVQYETHYTRYTSVPRFLTDNSFSYNSL
jgi:hypothetical protein